MPVSNGLPQLEDDEDEDEQGEKFDFDDSYDSKPTETSDRNLETEVSNSVQETEKQEENGTTCTGPKGPNASVNHQDGSGRWSIYTVMLIYCQDWRLQCSVLVFCFQIWKPENHRRGKLGWSKSRYIRGKKTFN